MTTKHSIQVWNGSTIEEPAVSLDFSVPDLDIDSWFAERGRKLSAQHKTERRIVAALCAFMQTRDWFVSSVWDGEEDAVVEDVKAAMELVFNLDEARIYFLRPGCKRHNVYLVMGNGEDIVSDWNFSEGDLDGFDAAMNSFLDTILPEVK